MITSITIMKQFSITIVPALENPCFVIVIYDDIKKKLLDLEGRLW